MNFNNQYALLRNQIKFMQWDITKRCNLRCKHCRSTDYYEGKQGEQIQDLSTEEVFQTLDDLAKNGVNRIHFLGGEPFMRPDLLKIVKYASTLGIVCSINTNGTLLTDEIIDQLFDSHVYLLTFSLDGASPETNDRIRGEGVFDKVCANIRAVDRARKAKKRYLRIITSPVITKVNRNEAKELCYLAQDLGLDSIILTTLRRKGRAKENLQDLGLTLSEELDVAEEIAQLIATGFKQHIQLGIGSPLNTEYLNKKYHINLPISPGGCNSLKMKGFIQPDGALFPCQELTHYYILNQKKKEIARSSIPKQGFDSIWNSQNYVDLMQKMFNIDMKSCNTPCDRCKYIVSYCYPCPLPALRNNGTIHHESCMETLRRAKRDGIELLKDEVIPADFYAVVQKAIDDFQFRTDLLLDLDQTLRKNNMCMNPKEKEKMETLIQTIFKRLHEKIDQFARTEAYTHEPIS